jgi:hypothetical protein
MICQVMVGLLVMAGLLHGQSRRAVGRIKRRKRRRKRGSRSRKNRRGAAVITGSLMA